MTAKGKINASAVNNTHRIIVNTNSGAYEGDSVRPSQTKTGEGVVVTRVLDKLKCSNRRGYMIVTGEGSFYAEPIQTMILAPEDPAGIKRAHVEALAEDNARAVAQAEIEAPIVAKEIQAAEDAGIISAMDATRFRETHAAVLICNRRSYAREAMGRLALRHLADIRTALAEAAQRATEAVEIDQSEELTLNSHGGKVGPNSENETEEPDMTSTDTETAIVRELTGSAVVKLLERVHERIRQNHPEVPEVVIVTGAGIGFGAGKWGHFRPQGWTTGEASIHEMFMAGETLAKGSRQVLQTMLHESAHALAEHRGEKDTSRQGRWHNQVFLKTAKELGLEYKANGLKADKTLGFSQVTLTAETVAEYSDLLDELDAEIHLMVRLPGWLGGSSDGDEDEGGENMGKAPKTGPATNSNNAKLTCECEEPNIIRASKKVAAKMVVRCDDCEALFAERD